MKFENYRIAFIAISLIGILLFASPTIALFLKAPPGEQFSIIYILGPNHTFDGIPFDVEAGITYSVFVGVQNQMGSPQYYTCYVKLANESEQLPDPILGTVSPMPALYEYKSFINNGATWEAPLTFEVNQLSFSNNISQLSGLTINGIQYPVNSASAWDSNKTGYYYNIFVELWLLNSTLGTLQYNSRFVNLILNMTQ